MPKRAAPTKLTGGGGFRFEDHIAARFLLDMLSARNSLGAEYGGIRRIDWQAKDAGWHLDDLLLTCGTETTERAAGLSIKSNRQVTRSGFPAEFTEAVWSQWLAEGTVRQFHENQDALVLVTGQLASGVESAWAQLLQAALETTADRLLSRIAAPTDEQDGGQMSEIQRALFRSFHCPQSLQDRGATGDAETVRVLRHIRLLHFDYESPTSRERDRALADCQRILRSGDLREASDLWDRLVGFAAKKRDGGSADLAALLDDVRSRFDLLDYPDYRADWDAISRHSRAAMDDVKVGIAGIPSLLRETEVSGIRERLANHGIAFVVGESGSGKSALARVSAEHEYTHVLWPPAGMLDCESVAAVEDRLGTRHPLADVLIASAKPCLVVFDALERTTDQGLHNVASLIRDVRATPCSGHVHVLLICQFEHLRRVHQRLVNYGIDRSLLDMVQIPRPSPKQIGSLVAGIPNLHWSILRPQLRSVLTNLKVLDWVVQAVQGGRNVNGQAMTGLSGLIDWLWTCWVEAGDDGLAQADLLKRIGILEAEGLSAGIPLLKLTHPEVKALPPLIAADLLRCRDEQVRFSHDQLGDWARMKVLVGEPPAMSADAHAREASLRWHRAVRLYAQRLLESGPEGQQEWTRFVERLDSGDDAAAILQNLFLEALFVGTNTREVLDGNWATLIAQDGRLLSKMLHRFLFVGTLPDPRLAMFVEDEKDVPHLEHAFRIPFWPCWGPVLSALHAHATDTVKLVGTLAARICMLWLKETPCLLDSGQPFPWRREAAELAVAIADEEHARTVAHEFSSSKDQVIYEALLWAARDLPAEVGALCLELARRREFSEAVKERAAAAEEQRAEQARKRREADPEREAERQRLCTPLFPFGPLREPWPDGPRGRVPEAFQKACLESGAFVSLAQGAPDVALEVLLAVCIEEPQHEDPYGNAYREDLGLDHWLGGHPPFYRRGPFLAFLQVSPEQGLTFILRLVNFVTTRWRESEPGRLARYAGITIDPDAGITVTVNGAARRWHGDEQVFGWYQDFGNEHDAVTCALMALEWWLYDQMDRDECIDQWIERILQKSKSIAFAGLLLAVGKRFPGLFAGALRPLMAVWELVQLDHALQPIGPNLRMAGWVREPRRLAEQARVWYDMPHRRRPYRELLIVTMLNHRELWPFFEEVRGAWNAEFADSGGPELLGTLIREINPESYNFTMADDGRVLLECKEPDEVRQEREEFLRRNNDEMLFLIFPTQCRQRLDNGTALSAEELTDFWDTLQRLDSFPEMKDEFGHIMRTSADAVCGGIAVLLTMHRDWLAADPDKEAWCMRKLIEVVESPPRRSFFSSEETGSANWYAFVAECGVLLLVEMPNEPLVRLMVARGITAFHYATTGLTIQRAFKFRDRLADDFHRLLHLGVEWARVRCLLDAAHRWEVERTRWEACINELVQSFIDGNLAVDRPALPALNTTAVEEIEEMRRQRFPDREDMHRGRTSAGAEGRGRERLHPELPGLDLRVVHAVLHWLDVRAARSADERREWMDLVRQLQSLCLGLLPVIEDPERQEIDGLPSQFENWVFQVLARTVPQCRPDEQPEGIWKPILDLGVAAHHWVEHFFWEWFTTGVQASNDPETFTRIWSEMIRYAVTSPAWDPDGVSSRYTLGDMVRNLFGCHRGVGTIAKDERFTEPLKRMVPLFEQAANRWFCIPRVAQSFAHFAVEPGARALLTPGIRWLHTHVQTYDEYDWRERSMEDSVVELLRTCWECERREVIHDTGLRDAFLGLLICLVGRGGHAAASLNETVLASINNG
jgi:hypothetical protein